MKRILLIIFVFIIFQTPQKSLGQGEDENYPLSQYHNEIISALQLADFFPQPNYGSLEEPDRTVETVENMMTKLTGLIPDTKLANGIKHYIDIINAKEYDGAGVGVSNAGVSVFNQNQLASNPCFGKIAEAFYEDLYDQDLEFKKNNDAHYNQHEVHGRARLADESGKGVFKNLKPGWLYNKALKYTNGNHNLAFQIIGLCGHDDTAHGNLNYSTYKPSDYKRRDVLRSIDELIEQAKVTLETYETNPPEIDPSIMYDEESDSYEFEIKTQVDYIVRLKRFRNEITDEQIASLQVKNRSIQCPEQNSIFYLPKALDERADITDTLKDDIEYLQAPNKGKRYLPAKAYHFMGAGFMTCQLMNKGVEPNTAVTIQKLAAYAYRTLRISQLIEEHMQYKDTLDKEYEKFADDFVKENTEYYSFKGRQKSRMKKPLPTLKEWFETNNSNDNYQIEYEKVQEEIDAAVIYKKMTVDPKIINLTINLNFMDEHRKQQVRLSELLEPGTGLKPNERRSLGIPQGWSNERFIKAKNKARTWFIDQDWSVAQHEKGAAFAASKCSQTNSTQDLDALACDIFDTAPGYVCQKNYEGFTQFRQTDYDSFDSAKSYHELEFPDNVATGSSMASKSTQESVDDIMKAIDSLSSELDEDVKSNIDEQLNFTIDGVH